MSSGEYARRRMTWRGPLTGLVLLGIVAYGAYWGWQSAFREAATTTPTVGCPSSSSAATGIVTTGTAGTASVSASISIDPRVLAPSAITVNVYNATNRPGLAANTASALRGRGFTIGETSNDPLGKVIPGVAEIRAGSAELPEVQVIIQHVPGAIVVPDGRTDGTVDLVLGDSFTALGNPATVTPVLLPSSSTTC